MYVHNTSVDGLRLELLKYELDAVTRKVFFWKSVFI